LTPVSAVISKYLAGYAEQPIPAPPQGHCWDACVVIPAYAESAGFLNNLISLQPNALSVLVIVVINRPESDSDTNANEELRCALQTLPLRAKLQFGSEIRTAAAGLDVLILDIEARSGSSPRKQGVGLARKVGCDLALHWHAVGSILSPWLYSSDADAQWPKDYFLKIPNAAVTRGAVTFPFFHAANQNTHAATITDTEEACLLYELRLHHYVLGLRYANSPYAFHTLGSSLAVHAIDYAAVRGFPRRAAGEDFYLLNKVAKVGGVQTLSGQSICLSSRASTRVPFGTGPAVGALLAEQRLANVDTTASKQLQDIALFYHPACFEALKAVLAECATLANEMATVLEPARLIASLPENLVTPTLTALAQLKFEEALSHCHRQCQDATAYLQHLHQWLDGFRTLKFIHAIRAQSFADMSLHSLTTAQPNLLALKPDQDTDIAATLSHVRQTLNWQVAAATNEAGDV